MKKGLNSCEKNIFIFQGPDSLRWFKFQSNETMEMQWPFTIAQKWNIPNDELNQSKYVISKSIEFEFRVSYML